jgi:hypothetical protein
MCECGALVALPRRRSRSSFGWIVQAITVSIIANILTPFVLTNLSAIRVRERDTQKSEAAGVLQFPVRAAVGGSQDSAGRAKGGRAVVGAYHRSGVRVREGDGVKGIKPESLASQRNRSLPAVVSSRSSMGNKEVFGLYPDQVTLASITLPASREKLLHERVIARSFGPRCPNCTQLRAWSYSGRLTTIES